MKKMLVLVLVGVLAVSGLCSCSDGSTSEISSTSSGNSSVSEISQTSSKSVNTKPINAVSEPQGEITVLSSSDSSRFYILRFSVLSGEEDPFMDFGWATDLGVCAENAEEEEEDSSLAGTSVTPNEDWGTLDYFYTEYKKENIYSEEYGTFYSAYDVYKYHGNTVKYLKGTDIISYYKTESNLSGLDKYSKSEEESRQIAEDFLLKYICTQDELEKYTYNSVEKVDSDYSCCVSYVRYILGYETDEIINVYINREGKVWEYTNSNRMKFDLLPETLTKEDLDNAIQKMKDKVNSIDGVSNTKFGEPRLTTSTMGELYIVIGINYTIQLGEVSEEKSEALYVKV